MVGLFYEQQLRSTPAHGKGFSLSIFPNINNCMENQSANRYKTKSPSRGGARPGAGRPKGSTAMITGMTLIQAIEQQSKKPFEELLAKVVSDRTTVETVDSQETVEAKASAFADAVAILTGKK